MFENYPDLLTVEQVMKALSIGKNSVYSLLHNKTIRYLKVGKKYFIPKECLINFIDTAVV